MRKWVQATEQDGGVFGLCGLVALSLLAGVTLGWLVNRPEPLCSLRESGSNTSLYLNRSHHENYTVIHSTWHKARIR